MEGGREKIPRGKIPSVALGKHLRQHRQLDAALQGEWPLVPWSSISLYFPRPEAGLQQPLASIWGEISPLGGG